MSWASNPDGALASGWLSSAYAGLGIPGSQIPTTGDNGGSPVLNDGISPTSEYRWTFETVPAAGAFSYFENLSVIFRDAPNGEYSARYRLWEDGADRSTATLALQVGSPALSVAANTAPVVGSMAFGVASSFSVAANTAPAVGLMSFKSQPVLAVAANLAPVVGAMAFATRPRFAVAGNTAPTVGAMVFLSGVVADVPGELCLAARPLGTISGNIRKRWNISFEVRPL